MKKTKERSRKNGTCISRYLCNLLGIPLLRSPAHMTVIWTNVSRVSHHTSRLHFFNRFHGLIIVPLVALIVLSPKVDAQSTRIARLYLSFFFFHFVTTSDRARYLPTAFFLGFSFGSKSYSIPGPINPCFFCHQLTADGGPIT